MKNSKFILSHDVYIAQIRLSLQLKLAAQFYRSTR